MKHALGQTTERGFADMALDLFTSLLAIGVQLTLVLGGMLFLFSLGRDFRSAFLGHE